MREIVNVEVLPNYELLLTFDNKVKKIKDMKPYLEQGVYRKLKEKEFFNKVKISFGTISWGEDIDMCADSLYETSTEIKE